MLATRIPMSRDGFDAWLRTPLPDLGIIEDPAAMYTGWALDSTEPDWELTGLADHPQAVAGIRAAFGASRGGATGVWPDDKAFLGMSADTETGLTHIGAREYDPSTGQFISVDPLMQLDLHQTLNGYSYGMQNPATFSDPDGRKIACGQGHDTPCPKNDSNGDGVVNPGKSNTNVPPPAPVTWRDEGYNTKSDLDDDGFVNLLPGVYMPAEWSGNGKFIEHFYSHLEGLTHYGIDFYAEHQDVAYVLGDIQKALLNACHATGCPSKKEFFYNWAGTNVIAGMSEGGVGRRVSAGTGSRRNPGAEGGCRCFLAGTDVLMADGSTRDIEGIKAGDEVLAADPETGEVAPCKVTRLIRTDDDKKFNELSIATSGGIEQLVATHEHPFWSPSEKRWVEAGHLDSGMSLLTGDGETVVVTGNSHIAALPEHPHLCPSIDAVGGADVGVVEKLLDRNGDNVLSKERCVEEPVVTPGTFVVRGGVDF